MNSRKPKRKLRSQSPKPKKRVRYPSLPAQTSEAPEYYWEGEDGEGYKEDGCPWIFHG